MNSFAVANSHWIGIQTYNQWRESTGQYNCSPIFLLICKRVLQILYIVWLWCRSHLGWSIWIFTCTIIMETTKILCTHSVEWGYLSHLLHPDSTQSLLSVGSWWTEKLGNPEIVKCKVVTIIPSLHVHYSGEFRIIFVHHKILGFHTHFRHINDTCNYCRS